MGLSWDGADELIDRTVRKLEILSRVPRKKIMKNQPNQNGGEFMKLIKNIFKALYQRLFRQEYDLDYEKFQILELKKYKELGDYYD